MGTEVGQNIRVIGVFGEKRLAYLPDVPTVKEQGYDVSPASFGGLLAPRATPQPILSKLSSACAEAAKNDLYATIAKNAGQPDDYFDDAAAFQLRLARDIGQQGARAVAPQDTIKKNPGARPGFSTLTLLRKLTSAPRHRSPAAARSPVRLVLHRLDACCTGASIAPVCCGATAGGLIAASLVQRSLNSTAAVRGVFLAQAGARAGNARAVAP